MSLFWNWESAQRTAHTIQEQDRMQLKPLGHRLLVRPDRAPEMTTSGLHIPRLADDPPMSGTVIAVGDGPMRERHTKRAAVARCLAILDRADQESSDPELAIRSARADMQEYMASADAIGHTCQVGDRIIFPMEVGHEIVFGEATDDAVVVLTEDAVLAICEPEKVAV